MPGFIKNNPSYVNVILTCIYIYHRVYKIIDTRIRIYMAVIKFYSYA